MNPTPATLPVPALDVAGRDRCRGQGGGILPGPGLEGIVMLGAAARRSRC